MNNPVCRARRRSGACLHGWTHEQVTGKRGAERTDGLLLRAQQPLGGSLRRKAKLRRQEQLDTGLLRCIRERELRWKSHGVQRGHDHFDVVRLECSGDGGHVVVRGDLHDLDARWDRLGCGRAAGEEDDFHGRLGGQGGEDRATNSASTNHCE
ncbi:unnamed protein product [Mycena citricolor]|uniref:Uncharacterized protein n=1 Tax=Mycena citricolor TaxID=2018698 RepID=A0AAD2K610_9AGAR|nr:unnamed protein product [Mycena citricolor]